MVDYAFVDYDLPIRAAMMRRSCHPSTADCYDRIYSFTATLPFQHAHDGSP